MIQFLKTLFDQWNFLPQYKKLLYYLVIILIISYWQPEMYSFDSKIAIWMALEHALRSVLDKSIYEASLVIHQMWKDLYISWRKIDACHDSFSIHSHFQLLI